MNARLQSAVVTVDGLRIHYVVGGPEGGPALVLVHGIGGGLEDWSANWDFLIEKGFRVYALALPGHGSSDPPPHGWNPIEGGRTLLQILDAWGIKQASLVGHSAGGLIVMQTALEAPERVKSLVLTAPGGLSRKVGWSLRILTIPLLGDILWRPWRFEARQAMEQVFADRSQISTEMVETWMERRRDPTQRKAFLQLLRRSVGLWGLRGVLDLRDRVQEITCPTLIVWGRNDQVLPLPQENEGVIDGFPQGRLVVLSSCGHWPQVEQAEAFNREVGAFLEGVT